jgi:hypothetical protein
MTLIVTERPSVTFPSWLTCLTCPPLLPTLAASTRPPVGGTSLNFLPAHGARNVWEEKMMRTVLLFACCVVLLGVSSPATAQPRIVVTDSDCAHFPNGVGSGVTSGTTITLNTDLTVDSNGNDCIVIANVTRVKVMLNGHTINLSGTGLAGIRIENSSRVDIRVVP